MIHYLFVALAPMFIMANIAAMGGDFTYDNEMVLLLFY
jgi:hypothetical protein